MLLLFVLVSHVVFVVSVFFVWGCLFRRRLRNWGPNGKKKHLGWSFVKKRRPETAFFAENSFFLKKEKKGSRQNPEREPPSFQGEPPKFKTLVFVED